MQITSKYERRTHTIYTLSEADLRRAVETFVKRDTSTMWPRTPEGETDSTTIEFDCDDDGRYTATLTRTFVAAPNGTPASDAVGQPTSDTAGEITRGGKICSDT